MVWISEVCGAQIALLVGVQDRDQAAFRDVQALAQQVDPDQDVEHAKPEITNDFNALEGVDVRMEITDADAVLVQVLGQVLGHALGQRRDQDAQAARGRLPALGHQVVDLALDRADDAFGIDQPGRPDHLLREHAAGLAHLPRARGRRDEHRLRPHQVPFLELQGPVVDARRQAEAELGERRLALEVAPVHRRPAAAPRCGSHRRSTAPRPGCTRTASAAARPAAGRSDSANSSRSRGSCRSR